MEHLKVVTVYFLNVYSQAALIILSRAVGNFLGGRNDMENQNHRIES